MTKIRKRQAKFVGHVIRRNQLEHLVTAGKFDGKRGRGRPREKMLDSLADWMNIEKPSEMIRKMSCRVVDVHRASRDYDGDHVVRRPAGPGWRPIGESRTAYRVVFKTRGLAARPATRLVADAPIPG
ncbi:hypothetical protein ElyMa_004278500 [Elysia marginata]|uniref:Uncharacterized protein n=1 Tax=Elysia marginata TaxID=1093978 RepID=A0AAV4GY47_9GAST|nr:hypothetical protein ElyMa_004278500 [Elysia marginata]